MTSQKEPQEGLSAPVKLTGPSSWSRVSCPCCISSRIEPLVLIQLAENIQLITKQWIMSVISAPVKAGGKNTNINFSSSNIKYTFKTLYLYSLLCFRSSTVSSPRWGHERGHDSCGGPSLYPSQSDWGPGPLQNLPGWKHDGLLLWGPWHLLQHWWIFDK